MTVQQKLQERNMSIYRLAKESHVPYATVDPDNSASWYNFEKEGYVCIVTQPAYDGRDRRYYKLTL